MTYYFYSQFHFSLFFICIVYISHQLNFYQFFIYICQYSTFIPSNIKHAIWICVEPFCHNYYNLTIHLHYIWQLLLLFDVNCYFLLHYITNSKCNLLYIHWCIYTQSTSLDDKQFSLYSNKKNNYSIFFGIYYFTISFRNLLIRLLYK